MLDNRIIRLSVMLSIMILFGLIAVLGLEQAFHKQPDLRWLYIGGALLAFVSGFMVARIQINHLHEDFEIEVVQEKQRIGRLLSEAEIQEVRAKFKEKRQQDKTNVRFPLQRVVVRLLLLLPIIAVSFLVAFGAFVSGASFAAFVEDCRKRTLADF